MNSDTIKFNFRYGLLVATHPIKFILACLAICGLSGLGLLNMTTENNNLMLFVPTTSDFYLNNIWLTENHPPELRFNSAMLVGDNILDPDVIRLIYKMHKEIEEITLDNGYRWKDLCHR